MYEHLIRELLCIIVNIYNCLIFALSDHGHQFTSINHLSLAGVQFVQLPQHISQSATVIKFVSGRGHSDQKPGVIIFVLELGKVIIIIVVLSVSSSQDLVTRDLVLILQPWAGSRPAIISVDIHQIEWHLNLHH